MKTLLGLLLVILLLSSAQAQQVQEDIEQAIANWYSNTGKGQLVNVTQFGQASPSKGFIDKYNPKKTYCVNCEITRMELPRVRVIAPYGHPPRYGEVTPARATTRSGNHIAIITQSGEIELINDYHMYGNAPPPPPMKSKTPLLKGVASEFTSLWLKTCPFPMK
jgi:hypothetical protein